MGSEFFLQWSPAGFFIDASIAFLVLAEIVLLLKSTRILRERAAIRAAEPAMKKILLHVQGGEEKLDLAILPRNKALQSRLVDLAATLRGRPLILMQNLYLRMGFCVQDLRMIEGGAFISKVSRITALENLRKVRVPVLKEDIFPLLKNDSIAIRWHAMELLISNLREKSLVEVLKFLDDDRNQEDRGILTAVLAEYSEQDRLALPFLLKHSSQSVLSETILAVLVAFPNEHAIPEIKTLLQKSNSVQQVILALRAAHSLPTNDFDEIFDLFSYSENWVVRLYAARNLTNISPEKAAPPLIRLSQDPSYLVREAACKGLQLLPQEFSEAPLALIRKDRAHPCHKILVKLNTMQEFTKAANERNHH